MGGKEQGGEGEVKGTTTITTNSSIHCPLLQLVFLNWFSQSVVRVVAFPPLSLPLRDDDIMRTVVVVFCLLIDTGTLKRWAGFFLSVKKMGSSTTRILRGDIHFLFLLLAFFFYPSERMWRGGVPYHIICDPPLFACFSLASERSSILSQRPQCYRICLIQSVGLVN